MQAIVLANREFLPSYYRMRLRVGGLAPAFTPGQFVMVRPAVVGDPFLGRAFSIQRAARGGVRAPGEDGAVAGGEIEIVYRALGKGTTLMAALGRGSAMEVLGPLGKGFRPGSGPAILVGGGVGIPPLVALADRLASRAAPKPKRAPGALPPPLVLVGGRTRHDVLGVADFRRAGCRVRVATDDGSLGHRGLVTDLLEMALEKAGNGHGNGGRRPAVYACGPEGMLKAVRRIALAADLRCQLCLEANMACGFGGCMGCAIPVRGEGMGAYKLCCKDGPVFEARELRW
jgi:dihydroorotate dehydrogenase electron transfer subunit